MTDLRPVLTLLSPKQIGFLSALNHSHIRYEVAAHNFQKVIDAEREQNEINRQMFSTKAFDYENTYHTYAEIVAEMQSLASDKVTYGSVGTSFQGRTIPYVTIGSGRTVFLECGIHSREWVSTASCLWMMNALINDASLSYLTSKFKFIIVPTLNVDGYVYTHTTDRMWRKTRTTQTGTTCLGADPNRKYEIKT
jgi:murein tripeptide amidase MpaA